MSQSAARLRYTGGMANERAELRLRVPTDVKVQIEKYAANLGVPINTAAILLLIEGLRREHEKRGKP